MARNRGRVLVIVLFLSLAGFSTLSTRPAIAADPVLVGAGDIADCASSGDEATANLLDGIDGTVFTAGDNAYPDGAASDYSSCYAPSWGRHKARTRPAPGNHEYQTSGASGYFSYYGASAGPSGLGYYSYDLGAWHILSLNSEIGGSAMAAQIQWLKDDLAASPAACTLAYWHRPLFSSGEHGNNLVTQEAWKALHEAGADVVINGHDHDYERFAPQNPYGLADPNGIREFVVGTGGAEERGFTTIRPNSEIRDASTFGVIKLTLHATSYDWQFVPVAGQSFSDSGSAPCYQGTNLPATPTSTATALPASQTQLTLAPAADTYVDQANSSSSYATKGELRAVDGSGSARRSFIRFAVSGLPVGAKILSARLELFATNGSDSGGIFRRTSNTSWPESITWNTQPAIDGAQVAALGLVPSGTSVSVDLTSVVAGNGAYSFAITLPAGETNGLAYASDENTIGAPPPRLIILAQTSEPPATTPTNTLTPSATSSPTNTPIESSPTATSTPDSAPTSTNTPTNTFTPTSTNTPAPSTGGTFSFSPAADTYVSQSSPGSSYGGGSSFSIVGGTSAKQALIRFTVGGLPTGAVVQSARLRLYVTNDSTSGGVFNQITNTTWSESSTWSNKPAIDGPQLASLGAVALNSTVEIELASVITGNGSFSFAISLPSTNSNTLGYASREASTTSQRPQLVIVTAGGASASPTSTLTPTIGATSTPTSTPTATPEGSASTATSTPTSTPTWTPAPGAGGTFSFSPIADTYVSQASPDTAYGGSSSFSIVGGTSAKQAFICFTVSGLPDGAVVSSAKLRLYVTNDSTSGGIFTRISAAEVKESVTWNTRPAIDGTAAATLGALALNTFVDIDLTGVIAGNGTYNFAISLPSANTNTLGYASREASTVANQPKLTITLQ